MHPLHDYISKQLSDCIHKHRVVVWYDPRSEFRPFVDELCSRGTSTVQVGPHVAQFAAFTGSFYEVRSLLEPSVFGDEPKHCVAYLPGVDHDKKGSILMELEKGGDIWEPQLRRLARNVLKQKYTDAVIDGILSSDAVGYAELARASSEESAEPPSVLKMVIPGATPEAVLCNWLASIERDKDVVAKGGQEELRKLIEGRLGLTVGHDQTKWRPATWRYVLLGEFRADLEGVPPPALDSVTVPPNAPALDTVRTVARRLRADHAPAYATEADRVETEFKLGSLGLAADRLGTIDTFRFEERALLRHCFTLIADGKHANALKVIEERASSFWLRIEPQRETMWEVCRRMAELGSLAVAAKTADKTLDGDVKRWVDGYCKDLYRLDQAQRRMELCVANLDEDADERALGVVRRAYEDAIQLMAEGFSAALAKANWNISGILYQTRIQPDVVANAGKPVAFFMVDALRYEMGAELRDRLPKSAEISLRPAIGALPTITPVGMAALLPEASSSFAVVEQNGKLGSLVSNAFLTDMVSRRKFYKFKQPIEDIALDELLSLKPSTLATRLKGATTVVVRSQEIDHAGETGFPFQARQVMDTVIDNIARAIRRLAYAGIGTAVVTADHGHLFFGEERAESMRLDAPDGQKVELHRRCWVGRGGSTPAGTVRVTPQQLGYASDLDFVFPVGSGVFKAGGELAYHHGGISLQELVLPVLTVRLKVVDQKASTSTTVTTSGLAESITNRMVTFSVTSMLGGTFRPTLMSGTTQIGSLFGAVDAEKFDRDAGLVTLKPGGTATLALLLSNDTAKSARVVLTDPDNDAEIYKSDELPIRLM